VPVITITRGSLSASHKLTERLARELDCQAISREMIIEHGKAYGIEEFMMAAKDIMEKKPPHSWDPHADQIHHYLAIFKASLMDFVVAGNIIYHGLQLHFLLNDVPRVLRLKVVAPMEYRVRTLTEESSYSEAEAREHIENVDSQRISWAKFMYGTDFDEPTSYDMTLNMSNLNLDAMTEVVVQVVRRPEFRLDGGAMSRIKEAHLKARVVAHLIRSAATREMELRVECDAESGHVIIRRLAPTPVKGDWKKAIKEALADEKIISMLEVAEFN